MSVTTKEFHEALKRAYRPLCSALSKKAYSRLAEFYGCQVVEHEDGSFEWVATAWELDNEARARAKLVDKDD